MKDIYKVIEVLNDIDGTKITWESQDYSSFREAHIVKKKKNAFNTNPCVKYEVKIIQPEREHKAKTGII